MTVKDSMFEAVKEFESVIGCSIGDLPSKLRERLRWQISREVEARAMFENDFTWFYFNYAADEFMAGGIVVETVAIPGGEVRLCLTVTTKL